MEKMLAILIQHFKMHLAIYTFSRKDCKLICHLGSKGVQKLGRVRLCQVG